MATSPIVFLREKFVPAADAHISIYDCGIVLGATVTDLLRTFRHEPYALDPHLRRFYESCKYARLAPPISPQQATEAVRHLVANNASVLPSGGDLAVVLFITPGENPIYAGSATPGAPMRPTFCIHSFPLPFELFRGYFEQGIHLVTPSTRHVPPQCLDPKIKNRSRLHWWLAEQEAHLVDPAAMPLLLDLDGNLTEVGGANVLLVKDGAVLSPSSRNILRGVSRQIVMRLCAQLGIPFQERELQLHDALTADEMFVTTTPYCMAPVTRVNGIPIGSGAVGGLVFEAILRAWNAEVGMDIRAQVTRAVG
ncbi:MAG TPA: aminotransferase class IV [Bryobacteraceae bacterium]|nr:aminotransferase class IV [Bryobacteraceae bacterium]